MSGTSETYSCDHQKLFQDGCEAAEPPGSKDFGKTDPEALDELEKMGAKLHQQDTKISIYMSNGKFDMQFCVK